MQLQYSVVEQYDWLVLDKTNAEPH